ncbi:MAG: hypothetical protein SVE93_07545 [Candidatus Thermoplasmatota archaeon]|nr:hypothetical protein [Candidatus Thermoplasmatota archaeon]
MDWRYCDEHWLDHQRELLWRWLSNENALLALFYHEKSIAEVRAYKSSEITAQSKNLVINLLFNWIFFRKILALSGAFKPLMQKRVLHRAKKLKITDFLESAAVKPKF